jgi:hypothetical protein
MVAYRLGGVYADRSIQHFIWMNKGGENPELKAVVADSRVGGWQSL